MSNRERFLHWLEQIYKTGEAEMDCEALQAVLPAYADFEIGGGKLPAEQVALVRAHLAHCPDCADEYEGLRAVAQLEAQGGLPQAEEILSTFEAEPAPGGVAVMNQ
jgi:predicted anti-sigma-YlaC factor YlaD